MQRSAVGDRIEWEVWKEHEQIGVYATEDEADRACESAQPDCEWCADFARRTVTVPDEGAA